MNEVTKLYENAGVKYYKEICAIKNVIDKISNQECYFEVSCTSCPLNKTSFTAEKQLELIKWLGIRDEFNFYQNKVTKDWVFYDHEKDATHYNFELGLASWINYLWQDLTEEERKQIKNILE